MERWICFYGWMQWFNFGKFYLTKQSTMLHQFMYVLNDINIYGMRFMTWDICACQQKQCGAFHLSSYMWKKKR